MGNYKKILPLAFLTLFILTACANPLSKKPASETVQAPVAQEQAGTVNDGQSDVPVSRYGTSMKCGLLKNAGSRQDCELQVNEIIGSMLESEIISSFDIARCKELPGAVGKRCQEQIAETGVKGQVPAEEVALFNEIQRGVPSEDPESPMPVYDSTRCAELKTAGYMEYCEMRGAERVERNKFDEAIISNDKSRCDELSTEESKNECKRFFGEEITEEVVVTPEETAN